MTKVRKGVMSGNILTLFNYFAGTHKRDHERQIFYTQNNQEIQAGDSEH